MNTALETLLPVRVSLSSGRMNHTQIHRNPLFPGISGFNTGGAFQFCLYLLFLSFLTTGCLGKKDGPAQGGIYYREQGIASWYGAEFHQKPTANGEIYDMHAMTAAHRTLPLGTWVTVTDLNTKQSINVRINDRGPFVKDRIIDLSVSAAKELGIYEKGTGLVEVCCLFSERMLQNELGYWVQLGAFKDRTRAQEITGKLRKQGSQAQIITSGSLHRIRVGPFSCADDAYRTLDIFKEQGVSAYVIRDLLPLASTIEENTQTIKGPDSLPDNEEKQLRKDTAR